MHRRPGPVEDAEPVERAEPAAPPDLPSLGSQDELAAIRNMVARLSAAHPSLDAGLVEVTVMGAYDAFRQARVRAYVPILVERRSRRELRAASGQAVDDGAVPGTLRAHPGRAKD
ncbi:three-helix bundle dimerization domain-containing protein [Streptomyces sp. NPDC002962]|uniref:three-helix bundle dimerization domain-containing protein n=1 Tax=Streptomyces sp. NPDC002962 TaxID=3364674 RepID=UPI0036C7A59B